VTLAKANLGKALFWDEQLSSTRTMACGSCHQSGRGGSDPRSTLLSSHAINPGADGVLGTADDVLGSPAVVLNQANGALVWSSLFGLHEQVTSRLAPSFIDAGYAPELFWDGRAGQSFVDPETGETVLTNGGALENQALGPPLSSTEMGHIGRSWAEVETRVSAAQPLMLAAHVPTALSTWIGGRGYPELFAEAFGTPAVSAARIVMAIATYERTLFATQTPFDSVIAGTATPTPQEAAGMQLFGGLGCAGCHAGSLMSDNRYHYIGVRPAAEDPGREAVTLDPADQGAFRTPSLRNVALRPAYMHDGRFTTLEQVVDFYDRGGDFSAPNKPPVIRPLNLTPGQRAALLAFLRRPLTDPRVAAETTPFDRPSLYGESALVPQILTGGVPGMTCSPPNPVALEPAVTGNDRFTMGVFGGPAGSEAVLVLDDAEPIADQGIPASGSFARISTILDSDGLGGGFGSTTMTIPDDSALYGRTLFGRWYVNDPAAGGGIAATPSFKFTLFGPNESAGPVGVSRGAGVTQLRLAAGPNPFSTSATIRFELPAAARVKLEVFDVTGRAVRRLQDGNLTAGAHAIAWNGLDDRGSEIPGGVYFYRLDANGATRVLRTVRVE
jgi:cytochrome c peroxidase